MHQIAVRAMQFERVEPKPLCSLGGRDESEVLSALERNKRFLRGELAHRVNMKFAPEIRFRIDERFDEAERIDKLLRTPDVQRDLDKDDETE